MQKNSKFRNIALLPHHYLIAQIHQQIHDNQYSYIIHKSSPNSGV